MAISCLSRGERTGSRAFSYLWSYVIEVVGSWHYMYFDGCRCWLREWRLTWLAMRRGVGIINDASF
ncbi:Putative protein of unknown function [Podospora comata]|uniref:Uncharacterized protein n=1 Tax=Podospora comata TaxID=48703 RepID=A0ABY6S2V6_PODCO|nr:Putative protein of unknown function [Podospora comata]